MRECRQAGYLTFVLATLLTFSGMASADDPDTVASWPFDDPSGTTTTDRITKAKDSLQGHLKFDKGVRGSGLRFDGFTTRVVRKAENAPKLTRDFTIEAWIAPQEYSWNWTGIVDREKQHGAGFSLGIDYLGRVGLSAAVGGKWQGCLSKDPVPLLEWTHIAGTFDPSSGLQIYVNGEITGSLIIKGNVIPPSDTDLWIGMSHTKQYPELTERKPSKAFLSPMVFDGLIDEVKIHRRVLFAEEIKKSFASMKPSKRQPLHYRKMPRGPSKVEGFGAFYTRLKYAPEWERIWRIGDHADVLVVFDQSPVRMVFWRGTGYCPAWVTDNDKWVCDQGPESWNHNGCCEQMSDKWCRYGHVRILEDNDARVVVHWRTACPDITYGFNHVDPNTGWGEWSDEYYYVYPDTVAVRYQQIHSTWAKGMEWQQSELLNQPGTKPQDNIELNAITLVDLDGNANTYSWDVKYGRRLPADKQVTGPIQVMNLKSKFRHFVIGESGAVWKPFHFGALDGYSNMPCWNHWPVAQLPNDGRIAPVSDRPSSACLGTLYPVKHKTDRDDMMVGRNLYGMTDKSPKELAVLARSWNSPAKLKLEDNAFTSKGYDKNQRAYILVRKDSENHGPLKITLAGSKSSPVLNPAFVIKDWGTADVKLIFDNKSVSRGKIFRYAHRRTLESTDLIAWVKIEATKDVAVEFRE